MINSGTNPLVGRPNASPISCGGFLMAKWTESNPEETFYRSKLIDAVLLLKSLKYLKQLFVYQNQLGDMSLFTFRGVTVYACTWNRCNTWNICEQNWTKKYKLNDASGDTYGFLDLDDFGDLESSQKKNTWSSQTGNTDDSRGPCSLQSGSGHAKNTPWSCRLLSSK